MLEIVIAILVGVLVGSITGLLPGIHINLVAVFITSSISSLLFIGPTPLVVFITSLAITHTFIDFIPSIFLGAPEDDTFLSILPGHEMLKQGKGYEAVLLTLIGSLAAIPIILIFVPLFIYLLPPLEENITFLIPFVLIFISLYMILREEKPVVSLMVFILAGFLGFASLNLPVREPLLVLLSGLFGASGIVTSIKNKISLQKQKIIPFRKLKLSKKEIKNSLLGALVFSPFFSFLPALGSSYAALASSEFFEQSRKGFLLLVGSLNTIVMGLSFVTIYSINKSRTGAAAAVKEILVDISLPDLVIILASIVLAGTLAFFIGIKITKISAKLLNKVNYLVLSLAVLFVLILVVFLFSNSLGILVFITSTALGIFCILSGSRRTNLMGSLLIPTVLIYFF